MSLKYLCVYQSDEQKVRVGLNQDGGYVIVNHLEYDCFISCGIGNDIGFELEFCSKYPDVPCIAYDGTINELPKSNTRIQFVKKNIGPVSTESCTNLHDVLEKYHNIYLKMDIETFEYRWLQTLSVDHLQRIKQLVIEFHFPFTEPGFTHLDAPLPIDEKQNVLKKLVETHTLIHLHPNNCCGTTVYNDIIVPNVFECTYVRKDIQLPTRLNQEPLPTSLDRPNLPWPDIYLSSYPFVHTLS
jgi:hypothetical protein